MAHLTSHVDPVDGATPRPYRLPERRSGSRALGCLTAIALVPLTLAALAVFIYVANGISDTQNLNAKVRATTQELLRISEQREALMPEPPIIATIGLKELSRISWITCEVSGRGLGLGSTQYDQTCYLTRYIYLDPGPGVTSAEQFHWAAGRITTYGCQQQISLRAVEESIVFYSGDCDRATAPADAMAVQGDASGTGRPVVSVRSSYYVDFILGCKPYTLLCGPPVSEPIRI